MWVPKNTRSSRARQGGPRRGAGNGPGGLCGCNGHLPSTHIRNPRPRIKWIWAICHIRIDQISPCSRSVPHFLEPDSSVSTAGAELTRILEPWEVPQSSNHYPTEHSEVYIYIYVAIIFFNRSMVLFFSGQAPDRWISRISS